MIPRFPRGNCPNVVVKTRNILSALVNVTSVTVKIYDPDGAVVIDDEAADLVDGETGLYAYAWQTDEDDTDVGVYKVVVKALRAGQTSIKLIEHALELF